ncbi:MAG: GNAT family N-acetyltransferase [Granulosicoccus sp.]
MNSRLNISNQSELVQLANRYQSRAVCTGTRALIVVRSPPEGWLGAFAKRCDCDFLNTSSTTDRADRISALLGTERSMAVMQLGHNPDTGLLAAAAGTIKAGGIFIVGTCADPGTQTCTLSRKKTENTASAFSNSHQRLIRLATAMVNTHPDTVACVGFDNKPDNSNVQQTELLKKASAHWHNVNSIVSRTRALAEQDELLIRAVGHLKANVRSCVVITGRRGRGKSSLLARLALQFEKDGMDFAVTAPHASALSTFRQLAAESANRYFGPDVATGLQASTLMVDEAASFPLQRLQQYIASYQHVVLCTTVEGYEVSGRAFDVRLLNDLSCQSMSVLKLETRQSWRWSDEDALETFTDQLILNSGTTTPDYSTVSTLENARQRATDCQLLQVTQRQLVEDEWLLSQVHSLLCSTHYQTTTKDLEHLLDAPTVQLWIQKLNDRVVGIVVLEQEGGIHESLHEPIVAKVRRLPNQLLPQLLAQSANTSDALEKNYLRVLRIAVQPDLRRNKLASQLLQAVIAQSTPSADESKNLFMAQRISAIGASFAADDCSLGFWRHHGFTEFHRGFKLNPRSGKHAVAVLRSFDQATTEVLSVATDIHRDNVRARQTLQNENTKAMSDSRLSTRDVQLLYRFAAGQRSKHDTDAALLKLCNFTKQGIYDLKSPGDRQHELKWRRFVQQWVAGL